MTAIVETFEHALMITGFVFVMMLVIEYLNVLTRGNWDRMLARWRWGQSAFAAALGATPGCLGAYAVVSLYTHRVLTFGGLVAAMVATCGDEAFVMLALFPGRALMLIAVLFAVGLVSGAVVDVTLRWRRTEPRAALDPYESSHEEEARCVPFSRSEVMLQWQRCSAQRGWLSVFLGLFVLGVATGEIGHKHFGIEGLDPSTAAGDVGPGSIDSDLHGDHDGHDHAAAPHDEPEDTHGHEAHSDWDWVRVTLLITGLVGLLIVATVPDHFLEEHLWNHLAKVHIRRIFVWTLGAMVVTRLLMSHVDVATLVSANPLQVLLVACLVGIVPESGPHLVFVSLYAQGAIPFSILLASSVVQDGHGMIPMLAHSRRAFFAVKAVNALIGLVLGLLGYAMGW